MSQGDQPGVSLDRLRDEESFDDVTVIGLDLAGLDLSGKEFTGCTFRGCKGQETRWQRARLDECRFEGCDLTRMEVRGATLLEVRFIECKLMGVEWAEVGHLPDLGFAECVLDFSSFLRLPLRGAEFLCSQMVEVNLLECDLRGALFAGSELRGAVIRGCKLESADFSAATGALFDPAANESRGARISLETAALLARERGLVVADAGPPARGSAKGAGARARRR